MKESLQNSTCERHLDSMVELAGLKKKPAYTTGDVAKIIGLCVNSVINICNSYEPPGGIKINPRGLQSYRSPGGDRRIPYQAIITWLEKNDSYERDYGE